MHSLVTLQQCHMHRSRWQTTRSSALPASNRRPSWPNRRACLAQLSRWVLSLDRREQLRDAGRSCGGAALNFGPVSRFVEGRALRRGPGGRLPARRLWETGAPEDQIDSSIRSFRLRRRGPRRSQARSAGGAAAGCAGSRLAPPHQRAPLPRLLREKIRASHALRRCSAPLTTARPPARIALSIWPGGREDRARGQQ